MGIVELKEFDVIVVNGPWWNPLDAGIKIKSMSPYTHVLFVKNAEGDLYEANIGGVIDTNLFRDYAYADSTICRLRQELTEEQKIAMHEWCIDRQEKCQGYDYIAYVGFMFYLESVQRDNRWFCSEFPYWCFMENGIRISNKEIRFPYPSFFVYNPMFEIVWEGRMSIFKKLKLIAMFKDVKEVIKAETGEERKWYSPWSRTVIGAVVAFAAYGVSVFFGVAPDPNDLSKITDSLTSISAVVPIVYGAILSIYGAVVKIINAVKEVNKKEV
jgi:hypothetical protein